MKAGLLQQSEQAACSDRHSLPYWVGQGPLTTPKKENNKKTQSFASSFFLTIF